MEPRALSWSRYRNARSIPGLDAVSAAKMILRSRGFSSLDRIPDFRKEKYEAPGAGEIRSIMRDIPGKSKSSHPSLEGMEFDPDDFGKAIVALREAGESLFVSAHHGIPKAPGSNLVERLIASQDFRRAVRDNDRSAQLRICLEEITYDIWAYNYSTRTINLESAVRQDITDAKQAVAEIGHGPVDPNNFLTSTLNDRLARNPGTLRSF